MKPYCILHLFARHFLVSYLAICRLNDLNLHIALCHCHIIIIIFGIHWSLCRSDSSGALLTWHFDRRFWGRIFGTKGNRLVIGEFTSSFLSLTVHRVDGTRGGRRAHSPLPNFFDRISCEIYLTNQPCIFVSPPLELLTFHKPLARKDSICISFFPSHCREIGIGWFFGLKFDVKYKYFFQIMNRFMFIHIYFLI